MEFVGGPGPGIGEDLTIFHHLQSGQMGMSEDDDIKLSGKKPPSGCYDRRRFGIFENDIKRFARGDSGGLTEKGYRNQTAGMLSNQV